MKVLIDIGHPGHVHYFRNLINNTYCANQFLVVARKRNVIESLLKFYNIPYVSRGRGKDSSVGKIFYMLYADILILIKSLRFKPDLLLSFSSPYAAQVSALLRIPHIAMNDTDHTDGVHRKFTYPFSDVIITPATYQHDLGEKHIRLNGTIEYFYLHPKYFTPDPSIFDLLGIEAGVPYVIVRFVSWQAFHDVNQKGLSLEEKLKIIALLSKKYRVFISSENKLEEEFSQYQIKIPPHRMHDALAFSSLFVGESGTMASESALLGVPVVYINSLPLMCYLKLEQEYGILKHFENGKGVYEYIETLIETPGLHDKVRLSRDEMVKTFINPTDFLIWFIENYPESKRIMRKNPDYQNNFL